MELSRSEGYRRAAGKEEAGLAAVEDFFRNVVQLDLTRITGAEQNYLRGDLEAPSGQSIECKRQPIDPTRYPVNFVEVFEETSNPRHDGGFAALADVLAIPTEQLTKVRWKRPGSAGIEILGSDRRLSVSVSTMRTAALTVYVNPDRPTAHLYVYESPRLLETIREAVVSGRMVRGAGNSNDDTFAVFVPLPPVRWSRDLNASLGGWRYSGSGSEDLALQGIRNRLA